MEKHQVKREKQRRIRTVTKAAGGWVVSQVVREVLRYVWEALIQQ
jgi:hypothetical protein